MVVLGRAGSLLRALKLSLLTFALPAATQVDSNGRDAIIAVDTSMPAPAWALAERQLLDANADGVQLFVAKYADASGHLKGPEHWGITDGPDDAVEPIRNWPIAHALGGPETIIKSWSNLWEGHIDQYSRARVPEVASARDGIYWREFMPSFDWEHISEGLAGFYFYGLSRPTDLTYITRLRRFAGLYMNEDPTAPNYDSQRKLIRSLFNGSRGPNLGEPTPTDWDGPPIPGADPARRTRFLKATNIRGDHPLNLNTVNLALHTYMVTGEAKYRSWILEYVDAWRDRIAANGGNIPSNIGLDGRIGGEWGGKWYGGVFGWNSPDEGVRNYVLRGPPEAFGDALLVTGDQRYTAVLRRQLDNLYAAARQENGRTLLPAYHGDRGWYGFHDANGRSPGLSNRRQVEVDLYMWSLDPADLARLPKTGWIGYLSGREPGFPLRAFQEGLEEVRAAAERIRHDTSSHGFPVGDTRWAENNPVATAALVNLTLGANDPGGSGHGPLPLHAQVRHFDPDARRAGLPRDVAALVEKVTPQGIVLTLVNVSPFAPRTVVVQMGGYGEHQATAVEIGGKRQPLNTSHITVRLAPGAGQTLTIAMQRYANQPTLRFPWDR